MHTIGIIAEFNPLHNGHQYLIKQARMESKADYCIVVMSGDFTQRGIPAIVDKYARTRMALSAGADLVIEMPVTAACASAPDFARCGIGILNALGVTDEVFFGTESGELSMLSNLAGFKETDAFKAELQKGLRSGLSYPLAYMKAFSDIEDTALLTLPNNILAIEYLKAINTLREEGLLLSTLNPKAVKRIGSDYHSFELNTPYASATAIRSHLLDSDLSGLIPKEALTILTEYLNDAGPLSMDDFSDLLLYKLISEKETGFTEYYDVDEAFSNKILHNLTAFETIDSFTQLLKSKEITYARIQRNFLHILLDIKKEDMNLLKAMHYAPYARILGFRSDRTELLRAIKKSGNIPLLNKLADAEGQLSSEALALLKKDLSAAEIYRLKSKTMFKCDLSLDLTRGVIQYP